jgi:AsmA family protein
VARRPAWAWGLLGVVGAVLVGAAVCEALGWPFLVGPAQRMLADTLKRDVRLSDAPDKGRIHLLGGLRIDVPVLEIGSAGWSRDAFFLRAENAQLRVAYAALWRAHRGDALDIKRLHADRLVVHAERRDDGLASWQFGDPKAQQHKGTRLPRVRSLSVNDGELTVVDAPLKADIRAQVRLAEHTEGADDVPDIGEAADAASAASSPSSTFASAPVPGRAASTPLNGLVVRAKGTYGGFPVEGRLRSIGVTPLLVSDDDAPPVPVALRIEAGRASLRFRGTVTDVLKLEGMTGRVRVAGPSLSSLGDPLGVTLPTTGPFAIDGRVAKRGDVWNVLVDDATVGNSRLNAALTYDLRPKVPLLAGRVAGPRLLLADLLPSIGVGPAPVPAVAPEQKPPKRPGDRVLPNRAFDLPSLSAMDANVMLAFERAELGRIFALPLQPLRAHLTLSDGKLAITDLVARTADGSLAGSVSLDGKPKLALWDSDLRWSGVRLERWLNQGRPDDKPPYVTGRLIGQAKLKGQGRSTAEILSSLDGSVVTRIVEGKVSHLAMEGAGLDLAQALGVMVKGDELLTIDCALVDLQAKKGVLRPRAMVVDTKDSTVWADGTLSLAEENMDLRAVVTPKDFSPLALRTPLRVQGSFSDPKISLEKAPLARKVGSAVLLGLLNPLAALIPLIDPGERQPSGEGCNALLERARQHAQPGNAASSR